MNVAERMCDRIFMIFRGRKVLDGTLDEIQSAYGSDTVTREARGITRRARFAAGSGVGERLRPAPGSAAGRRSAAAAGGARRPGRASGISRSRAPRSTTSSCASRNRRRKSWRRRRPMRRVLTIARSEFQSAVRSRGFLIGIMLMPLLFGGAVVLQRVVERQSNSAVRRVGVVDETGQLFAPLSAAVEAWNRGKRDIGPDVPDGPRFAVERIAPGPDPQALRLALSERVPQAGAVRVRGAAGRSSGDRGKRADPLLLRGAGVPRAARLAAARRPEGGRRAALHRRERQPDRRRDAAEADRDRRIRSCRPRAATGTCTRPWSSIGSAPSAFQSRSCSCCSSSW